MSEKEKSREVIYSAPWVLPVASPAVRGGAVAVKDGRIEAVGSRGKIKRTFPGRKEVVCQGVLMPALVNSHIHLELSHLRDIERPIEEGHFCEWIDALIKARGENALSADESRRWRTTVLAEQFRSGVVLLGDIGNKPILSDKDACGFPLIYYFMEFLAPTKTAVDAVATDLAKLPDTVSATAHACYSTLPELICMLKERARRQERVFPIHVAESSEEVTFIQTGGGPFRGFLEQLGAWDSSFESGTGKMTGVVQYLYDLGVLDAKTLCVHCVHIQESEVVLLSKTGSHVCLCPGSNRFLKVGRAPLEMMLRCGVLPAIGTDSIASNERLDIWNEMCILREEHPTVEPKTILEMATHGGAAALGCEEDFGGLSPRKRAMFLRVDFDGIDHIASETDLVDILTRGGCPKIIEWVGK